MKRKVFISKAKVPEGCVWVMRAGYPIGVVLGGFGIWE